jgi:hypothetical protein
MSELNEEITDIAELPAVEILSRYTIELLSVAAIHCGLAENGRPADLDEARKIIDATAGLITGAAPYLGDQHARPLRAALREIQLAFREASSFPDAPGAGPGEKFTGPVA